jgi:hypothetical protein
LPTKVVFLLLPRREGHKRSGAREIEREDEQRTRQMAIDELVVIVVLLFAAPFPSIPVQDAAAAKLRLTI